MDRRVDPTISTLPSASPPPTAFSRYMWYALVMQSIVSARNTRRRGAPCQRSNNCTWACAVDVGEDEEKEEEKSESVSSAHTPVTVPPLVPRSPSLFTSRNVRRRSGSTSYPCVKGKFGPSSFAPSCATTRRSTAQQPADNSHDSNC